MTKTLALGAVALGAVLLARRTTAACGALTVEKMLERMPETAPPKWMFTNVAAIRENTERILQRLDELERAAAPAPDERGSIAD